MVEMTIEFIKLLQNLKVKQNRYFSKLIRDLNLTCQPNEDKEARYNMWWSARSAKKCDTLLTIETYQNLM